MGSLKSEMGAAPLAFSTYNNSCMAGSEFYLFYLKSLFGVCMCVCVCVILLVFYRGHLPPFYRQRDLGSQSLHS